MYRRSRGAGTTPLAIFGAVSEVSTYRAPPEALDVSDRPEVRHATKRKSISKSIRFEVFKRDSFRCQYCGAPAPDVLLEIDHIKPIVDGGTGDISNLITACEDCNAGKGPRPLTATAAIAKVRAELEQLRERRVQLEMTMAWMEELRDLSQLAVDRLCNYWSNLAPGWEVDDCERRNLARWRREFSIEEICLAMNAAAERYLSFGDDGCITQRSWKAAFDRIPKLCRGTREESDSGDVCYPATGGSLKR